MQSSAGNTHIFQADRSSRHDRISEQREKEKRAMEEKEVAEQEAANANAKLEQEQEQRTWEVGGADITAYKFFGSSYRCNCFCKIKITLPSCSSTLLLLDSRIVVISLSRVF